MTLLILAVAAGLSPYIPLLIYSVAAAAWVEPSPVLRPEFDFMMRWEFLGILLVMIGLDIILGKLPVTARYVTILNWFAKPAAAALIAASWEGPSVPYLIVTIVAAMALAVFIHGGQVWLIERLRKPLKGFERVAVGAYSELGTVLVAVFAFLAPVLGAALAAIMVAGGVFLGRKRWTSEA